MYCSPRAEGGSPNSVAKSDNMIGQLLTAKNAEFEFGDFVHATEPTRTINNKDSMDEQTSDGICMEAVT